MDRPLRQPLPERGERLHTRALKGFAVTPRVALLAILALGAVLRFANLGLLRHSFDYAYPGYDALRILDGHRLLLLGQPSSVFLNNPPLMAYLQAIPLLVWRSPWAVYVFITALNTLAIVLVYRVGCDLLGETVGLVAALLFAINPWMVHFSRATWLPGLMPLFTAAIAWGLWPSIARERPSPRRVLVAGLAMAAMMQAYIQAWGVLGQVGPLVVAFRRRLPRRSLYVGAMAICAVSLLYGIGIARSWTGNRSELAIFFSRGQLHLTRAGLDHAVRLVSGRDFDYVFTREQAGDYPWRRTASLVAHYLLLLALVGGTACAVLAWRKGGTERRIAPILLLWFLVPILLMSVSAHPVHPYYLLLSCPAGHILAAWGIASLSRDVWPRRLAIAALLAITVLFSLNLERAAQQVAARPIEPEFDNWALAVGARMGATVRELVGSARRPVRIAAEGKAPLLSSLSGTYVTTLLGLDYPSYVMLPGQEPLVYVLADNGPQPGVLGPQEESFPQRDMLLADGSRISFLRSQPYSREAALGLPAVPLGWGSEAGFALLGYTLGGALRPGQPYICTTYWRVDELRPERWEWYVGAFYHLLDRDGRMVANVSGHGQWANRWQLGDVYVERMNIPLPADLAAGEYRLEIGLFDTIHGRNWSLQGPAGPQYSLIVPVRVEQSQ